MWYLIRLVDEFERLVIVGDELGLGGWVVSFKEKDYNTKRT